MRLQSPSLLTNLAIGAVTLLTTAALCAPVSAQAKAFSYSEAVQGVTFKVTCPNQSSLNNAAISAKSKTLNASTTLKVDGTVTGAKAADLNADGTPDLAVFSTSAGSGSYGTAYVYATGAKGLTAVAFPALAQGSKETKGYMGHDTFSVAGGSIVRSFPIYGSGDSNAKPTGKTRTIVYTMTGGKLVMKSVTDK